MSGSSTVVINNNLRLLRLRHTAQQQPGLTRGSKQPDTNGTKLLTVQSGRSGRHLVSIHQMAPPEHTSDKQAYYSFIDP